GGWRRFKSRFLCMVALREDEVEEKQDGQHAAGPHLPLSGCRHQVAVEEAQEKVAAKLEGGGMSLLQPFAWTSHGSTPHRGDDTANNHAWVFLLGELRENAFERRLLHQVAQALDGVVRHDLPFAQDQDR